MKVIFKEVDQGDSIFLIWEVDGVEKIAIIDCNLKKDKSNPVLNEIKRLAVSEIEFIILSHPHTDHFSGLNQLFDYCASKNIVVHRFIQTCEITRENLLASVKGFIARSELEKLFEKVAQLHKGNIIRKIFTAEDSSRELVLNDKWKLKFLAPTFTEKAEFIKRRYAQELMPKDNSGAANYLCTLIKIYSKDEHILLTSDVVKEVFQREVDEKFINFDTTLILGQIPHHGSKENFHNYFWKKQKIAKLANSAISVGENIYGHPSISVIENLSTYGYSINLTCNHLTKSSRSKLIDLSLIVKKGSITTLSSKQDLIFDVG